MAVCNYDLVILDNTGERGFRKPVASFRQSIGPEWTKSERALRQKLENTLEMNGSIIAES